MANSWVLDVKSKLGEFYNNEQEAEIWRKKSIYRVPICLHEMRKTAYKPQLISFGPYHYGEENLQTMEDQKQRALLHILRKTNKPIEDYVEAIREIEQQLKDCYDRLDEKWAGEDRNFLQLMILDGCFMLEILRTANGDEISNNYAFDDPIFSSHGKLNAVPFIRRDMLLLENQLPLMLLEKLMELEGEKTKDKGGHPTWWVRITNTYLLTQTYSVNGLVIKFVCQHTLPPKIFKELADGPTGLHVIDIYRKAYLIGSPKTQPESPDGNTSTRSGDGGGGEIVRSAAVLRDAGIRLKKSGTFSFKDITFDGGILTLPHVVVDDTTESIFLNLMAFERLHGGVRNEFTSYVFFLDNLIDSELDVSLLHSKGIIANAVGSDKAVAKIFNELSKDITLDPDSNLARVQKDVNNYYKKKWNTWRANLIHTYFKSPWALLSLLAAIFLLILTVAQTVYTVYPFYLNSSDSSSPSPSPPPPALLPPSPSRNRSHYLP